MKSTYLLMVLTFSPALRRMLAAQCLVGLGSGIFAVLFNLYLKSGGYQEDAIGRLLALQSLAAALASIPMGWVADRTSRRTAYLIGLSAISSGYFLASQSLAVGPIVLAAIIAGCGQGAMMVAVQPFLQEHSHRRQRPYLFSMNFSLVLAMNVLSGFLAGWLPGFFRSSAWMGPMTEHRSLQLSLLAGAGFIFLAILPGVRLSRSGPRPPGGTPIDVAGEAARAWPLLTRFMMTSALIGAGAGMIVPYFNLYFRDWTGASIAQIGTVFALGQFGTAIGGISSPWLARRFGSARGVVLTQMLSLPFMAIMAWRHEFWLCALCFIFRGAFMNMSSPLRQETLMERIPPAFRARASAADSSAWNLAWAGSMFVSGGIIRHHGYAPCLAITFGCYLISSILYYIFFAGTYKCDGPSGGRC
ncbi:MAG: Permease [Candidatus Ozemobacter sibiricus]|jgi:MFS family permease|uniref:Permease n=1 Tax=Candidatus Ozemobacter sibiricus TaxID=2268124 RepID=A0A367ZQA6_9BACT|nr:MAG: Permease [Candidatus Ozemobacter sibiricus]